MTTFKITATAPTQYQRAALLKFGMQVKTIGNGSFYSEKEFETEEEAKEYLIERAQNYYNDFEGQVDEHIQDIKRVGMLEIDGVNARIDEVQQED